VNVAIPHPRDPRPDPRPRPADAAFTAGLQHHTAGDLDRAETAYRRAVAIDPRHIGALFNLAALHASRGDLDEAGRCYRHVLEIAPADADALSNYGNLLQHGGKLEAAEDCYRRALAAKPAHAMAHTNLAQLLAASNRPDEAERHFRRGMAIAPRSPAGPAGLGGLLWRQNRLDEARLAFCQAIVLDPGDADSHCGLGNVCLDLGDYERAEEEYRLAIRLRPNWADAHFNIGMLFDRSNRRKEAKDAFREALSLRPDYVKALCRLGELEAEDGEFDAAEQHLSAAAEHGQLGGESEFHYGTLHHHKKNYTKAIAHFEKALELGCRLPEVFNNLGNSHLEAGNDDQAEAAFKSAIELKPDFAHAYNNLGKLYRGQRKIDLAEQHYRKAVELRPDFPVAEGNLGALLVEKGHYSEAAALFERALEREPSFALYNGLGLMYQGLNDNARSLECYAKALELAPDNPQVLNNLAIAYQNVGRSEEAVRTYNKVFDVNPLQCEAYYNMANLLLSMTKYDEAVIVYRKCLQINPHHSGVYPYLAHALMHQCAWDNLQRVTEQVIANTERELAAGGGVSATPFGLLSLPTSVDLRARVTDRVAQKIEDSVQSTRERNPLTYAPRGKKLKIAYVSPDLRNHSVAFLFNNVLRNHDRDRFEVHGYMVANYERDDMTEFFKHEFDSFTDLKDTPLLDATRKVNGDGINIMVDLAGHTRGAWMHLFAMHPAPIQATTIGYASSLGGKLADYMITDETLWPEHEASYCSEKFVYLPHTVMPGSPKEVADHTFTREEMGLPETGVVFANFNGHYKFDPETYAVWMRILKQVPGSVLWMMQGSATSRANLIREAALRGVPEHRLVFASTIRGPYHMARLPLADICLDSFYHVGGATTVDALWRGVPVVVTAGTNVSNRTGRNLLEVVEMPELIGATMHDYERVAVDLALNPAKLAATRAKLAAKVKTSPLFDIKLFTRHLESAYEMMWENYEAGRAPQLLRVPAITQ